MHTDPSYTDLINTRTILTGEVNTGKTTLTGKLAECICARGNHPNLLVLDMAPSIPDALQPKTGRGRISGFITFPSMHNATVFKEGLVPPRMMGTSAAHTRELAKRNQQRIDSWLKQARTYSPFDVLIVNDLSMYLQTGEAHTLEIFLGTFPTVIANGYMGKTLGKGGLSAHEREEMDRLCGFFDRRMHLEKTW